MAVRDFDDFYAEHFDGVARTLALAGAERELAHDAAQEAFTRALRHWRRVRDMDRPDGWVYVVAMNQLRDNWRKLEREQPESVAAYDAMGPVATRVTVRDVIALLPPRQRQAVVLRYLADLTVAEVAEAMDCKEGTVKAALHHALRAMRVELEEDDDADR